MFIIIKNFFKIAYFDNNLISHIYNNKRMVQIKTAAILAGGKGTRFSEYTKSIPKPMIEIKNKPMLMHIINIYKLQGIRNFLILTGYKSDVIFDYFNNKFTQLSKSKFLIDDETEVNLVYTGIETQTGGRVKQAIEFIDEDYFYLTYGDGLGNININELNKFHFKNETMATLTAVRPPARFGSLEITKENYVSHFGEKNNANEGWINGGFFILSKKIKNYIQDNNTPLEREPLEQLAKIKELKAYLHNGYWRPVDTIREKEVLEKEIDQNIFNFYE